MNTLLSLLALTAAVTTAFTHAVEPDVRTALRTIRYTAANATVPSASIADLAFSGGSGAAGGPKDAACSGGNIRTGNPGVVSRIQLDHPLLAPGYTVTSLSLAFRYAAGYTPPPGK